MEDAILSDADLLVAGCDVDVTVERRVRRVRSRLRVRTHLRSLEELRHHLDLSRDIFEDVEFMQESMQE